MTDKQLEEIRKRAEYASTLPFYAISVSDVLEGVPKLLAEIERLRTDQERLIAELKKADQHSEELERKYMAAKWPEILADISEFASKIRRERNGSDI